MMRKNIFQLVEENYDIQSDIIEINRLFFEEKYFSDACAYEYSLKDLIDGFLFVKWNYHDTSTTVEGFMRRVNADIDYENTNQKISEEKIVNNLETIDNFIKLYRDNLNNLYPKHRIRCYSDYFNVFCKIIDILEKRMGLLRREYKDKVILYPKNVVLEKALEKVSDEDVQWELIRYTREDLTLEQKKKTLNYLSTNLSIQKDNTEKNAYLKELLDKSCNILNNLHIRHNNKSGRNKNEILEKITNKEQEQLCDMLYDMMLNILIVRDLRKYEAVYNKFNSLQKTTP